MAAVRARTRADGSPFVGLVPFTAEQSRWFFGRDADIRALLANFQGNRLTLAYGKSGVGKSSLLAAGLLAASRSEAEEARARALEPPSAMVLFDRWSTEELVASLRRQLASALGWSAAEDASPDPATLVARISDWTSETDATLLLILDQFEEYFRYHPAEEAFASLLTTLATTPGLRVNLLLCIREDSLADLDRFRTRIPHLFADRFRLQHLDRDAAIEAIRRPIERYNEEHDVEVTIDDALVDAVIEGVGPRSHGFGAFGDAETPEARLERRQGRVNTAYLQLVMERLWHEAAASGSAALRLATLRSLGGVDAILQDHFESAVEDLSDRQRAVAANVFRFLVTPGGNKVSLSATELVELAETSHDDVTALLELLGASDRRIVRRSDGPVPGSESSYEIYHDLLGRPIATWARDQRARAKRSVRLYAWSFALSTGALATSALAYLDGLHSYQYDVSAMPGISDLPALAATPGLVALPAFIAPWLSVYVLSRRPRTPRWRWWARLGLVAGIAAAAFGALWVAVFGQIHNAFVPLIAFGLIFTLLARLLDTQGSAPGWLRAVATWAGTAALLAGTGIVLIALMRPEYPILVADVSEDPSKPCDPLERRASTERVLSRLLGLADPTLRRTLTLEDLRQAAHAEEAVSLHKSDCHWYALRLPEAHLVDIQATTDQLKPVVHVFSPHSQLVDAVRRPGEVNRLRMNLSPGGYLVGIGLLGQEDAEDVAQDNYALRISAVERFRPGYGSCQPSDSFSEADFIDILSADAAAEAGYGAGEERSLDPRRCDWYAVRLSEPMVARATARSSVDRETTAPMDPTIQLFALDDVEIVDGVPRLAVREMVAANDDHGVGIPEWQHFEVQRMAPPPAAGGPATAQQGALPLSPLRLDGTSPPLARSLPKDANLEVRLEPGLYALGVGDRASNPGTYELRLELDEPRGVRPDARPTRVLIPPVDASLPFRVTTHEAHAGPGAYAVDFNLGTGDEDRGLPVLAAAAGIVEAIDERFGEVRISHWDGATHTIYAHMEDIRVREGDAVEAGQPIGRIGKQGLEGASSFLHFQVLRDGRPAKVELLVNGTVTPIPVSLRDPTGVESWELPVQGPEVQTAF